MTSTAAATHPQTPDEIAYLRTQPLECVKSLAYEQTFTALSVLDQFIAAGRLKGSAYGLRRDCARAVAAVVEAAWIDAPAGEVAGAGVGD